MCVIAGRGRRSADPFSVVTGTSFRATRKWNRPRCIPDQTHRFVDGQGSCLAGESERKPLGQNQNLTAIHDLSRTVESC